MGNNAAVNWKKILLTVFANIPYTKEYKKAKTSRKAAPRGVPQSSTSGKTDMTLTGKMRGSIRLVLASASSFTIAISQLFQSRADGLADHNRDVTDSKVIDKLEAGVISDINRLYNKRAKVFNKQKATITIG